MIKILFILSQNAIKDRKEGIMYDREMYCVIEVLSSILYKCVFVSLVGNRHHKTRCIKGSIGIFQIEIGQSNHSVKLYLHKTV